MNFPRLSCYILLRCVIPKRTGVPLIPGSVHTVLDWRLSLIVSLIAQELKGCGNDFS